MRFFCAACLVILMSACEQGAAPLVASGPGDRRGKPSAPVVIQAELGARSAELAVSIGSDAQDVVVTAWGTRGLVVDGDPTVRVSRVSRGETLSVPVALHAFSEGSLAVSVEGVFGGHRQSKVRSFSLRPGSTRHKLGVSRMDAHGRAVQVVKASHLPR